MFIKTRIFGDVEIDDEKIITFEDGIIGFPDLKHFTLIYDEEKGPNVGIQYFQSIEEPGFAMPVMNPVMVCENYNPQINDEFIASLGEMKEEDLFVFVTVTVPTDLTKMTVNLQGPILINANKKKGAQIIVEGNDYPVRFPIYEILKSRKEG